MTVTRTLILISDNSQGSQPILTVCQYVFLTVANYATSIDTGRQNCYNVIIGERRPADTAGAARASGITDRWQQARQWARILHAMKPMPNVVNCLTEYCTVGHHTRLGTRNNYIATSGHHTAEGNVKRQTHGARSGDNAGVRVSYPKQRHERRAGANAGMVTRGAFCFDRKERTG